MSVVSLVVLEEGERESFLYPPTPFRVEGPLEDCFARDKNYRCFRYVKESAKNLSFLSRIRPGDPRIFNSGRGTHR